MFLGISLLHQVPKFEFTMTASREGRHFDKGITLSALIFHKYLFIFIKLTFVHKMYPHFHKVRVISAENFPAFDREM